MTAPTIEAHRAEFEQALTERREQLRLSIRESLDAMGHNELAREVGDIEDHALGEWLAMQSEVALQRDAREIADIDAALARLRSGRFGICEDCEEVIPLARLRAFPTARRCLGCQADRERQRP